MITDYIIHSPCAINLELENLEISIEIICLSKDTNCNNKLVKWVVKLDLLYVGLIISKEVRLHISLNSTNGLVRSN